MDFSAWRVELRRHVGLMMTDAFGLMPFEHPQKIVILHKPNPQPGERPAVQVGYLSDVVGTRIAFLPAALDELPQPLREHIEEQAEALRDAADFTDPPEAN